MDAMTSTPQDPNEPDPPEDQLPPKPDDPPGADLPEDGDPDDVQPVEVPDDQMMSEEDAANDPTVDDQETGRARRTEPIQFPHVAGTSLTPPGRRA